MGKTISKTDAEIVNVLSCLCQIYQFWGEQTGKMKEANLPKVYSLLARHQKKVGNFDGCTTSLLIALESHFKYDANPGSQLSKNWDIVVSSLGSYELSGENSQTKILSILQSLEKKGFTKTQISHILTSHYLNVMNHTCPGTLLHSILSTLLDYATGNDLLTLRTLLEKAKLNMVDFNLVEAISDLENARKYCCTNQPTLWHVISNLWLAFLKEFHSLLNHSSISDSLFFNETLSTLSELTPTLTSEEKANSLLPNLNRM